MAANKTQGQTIYRKDYTPPSFLIDKTELDFKLNESATRVKATLHMRRNPKAARAENLDLDGDTLKLLKVALDGAELSTNQYASTPEQLTIFGVPDNFTLETEVEIDPKSNTALEGLYRDSGGMLCTQCEAEGFRRITYFLDRPDVLSKFTVRLEGDKKTYPVILSNGNKIDSGDLDGGAHFAVWEDPFPKPSYLFALVAGELDHLEDSFTTMSGRKVKLQLFTEKHNMHKTPYAMGALKRSMKWDEERFGREYDLDIFMIVAVDAFNMGAMENKGLNIFNSSAVLASPDTSTDDRFMRIEAIVGHEYFHNWSGNRVTCRSWFELSLKEGFTVFRDAEFTADLNDRAAKRIEDVRFLRAVQFPEDAGPMAHPIRPESYQSINNFYTVTVYEKGCEVIGMYHTILGEDGFRKGTDLYFDRHDGEAATCEDFTKAMEDATGVDLQQFRRWYSQEGTPKVSVRSKFDASANTFTLTFKQTGKDGQKPFHIPVKLGLVGKDGTDLELVTHSTSLDVDTNVLHLTDAEQSITFENITEEPVPSLLRCFSVPVKLDYPYSKEDLMFLMKHDSDGFNRWDASQMLGIIVLEDLATRVQNGKKLEADPMLVEAFKYTLEKAIAGDVPPSLAKEALCLPTISYLAELQDEVDMEALQTARDFMRDALAVQLEDLFKKAFETFIVDEEYEPNAEQIGKRALKNLCLSYLLNAGHSGNVQLATDQFEAQDNMTDVFAALSALVNSPYTADAQEALDTFYTKWKDDPLVIETWFSVQSGNANAGTLSKVQELVKHPGFSMTRPNTVRSVIGAFTGSGMHNFHNKEGTGYTWLADKIIELDAINPQIAARLVAPLIKYKRFAQPNRNLMKAQLERIIKVEKLSKNTYEIVSKGLGA